MKSARLLSVLYQVPLPFLLHACEGPKVRTDKASVWLQCDSIDSGEEKSSTSTQLSELHHYLSVSLSVCVCVCGFIASVQISCLYMLNETPLFMQTLPSFHALLSLYHSWQRPLLKLFSNWRCEKRLLKLLISNIKTGTFYAKRTFIMNIFLSAVCTQPPFNEKNPQFFSSLHVSQWAVCVCNPVLRHIGISAAHDWWRHLPY